MRERFASVRVAVTLDHLDANLWRTSAVCVSTAAGGRNRLLVAHRHRYRGLSKASDLAPGTPAADVRISTPSKYQHYRCASGLSAHQGTLWVDLLQPASTAIAKPRIDDAVGAIIVSRLLSV